MTLAPVTYDRGEPVWHVASDAGSMIGTVRHNRRNQYFYAQCHFHAPDIPSVDAAVLRLRAAHALVLDGTASCGHAPLTVHAYNASPSLWLCRGCAADVAAAFAPPPPEAKEYHPMPEDLSVAIDISQSDDTPPLLGVLITYADRPDDPYLVTPESATATALSLITAAAYCHITDGMLTLLRQKLGDDAPTYDELRTLLSAPPV